MKAKTTPNQNLAMALAIALFSSILQAKTDPDQADRYFQAQQWQQAADSYRLLTREDRTNGIYWFRLGHSLLRLNQYEAAIMPLQQALEQHGENVPIASVLLSLARSQAATGKREEALKNIAAIEATGARPYQAVKNSVEFADFNSSPEFRAVLNKLKPCSSAEHRAFDLWIGEWEVTSPTRVGWTAQSSITVATDGCSIHEDYRTQGGYAGRSINFYDSQTQKWHQTWIDNQGVPLYLEGGFQNGAMVLSNETNRVTWSTQADHRVRQHWESTSDGGKTWTTAFDGYYRRQ